MSVEQQAIRASEPSAQTVLRSFDAGRSVAATVRRILIASAQAMAVTGIFLTLTFFLHFGLGLFAPLASGFMTGRLRKLTPGEAAAVGLILCLCVWVPLPLAQHQFGFLAQLSSFAVIFLSGVVAIYYGVLVGVAAWYGGYLAREQPDDDAIGVAA